MDVMEIVRNAEAHLTEATRMHALNTFVDTVNPILEAMGVNQLKAGEIVDIIIGYDSVRIVSEYTVMCCYQTDAIVVPFSLLTDRDPVHQANVERLERELAHAAYLLGVAQTDVIKHKQTIADIKSELLARRFDKTKHGAGE